MKLTMVTKTPCRICPDAKDDPAAHSERFGDAVTADLQSFNEENESRLQHRRAVVAQDLFSFLIGSGVFRRTFKSRRIRCRVWSDCRRQMNNRKQFTNNKSEKFSRGREDLCWNQDMSHPDRPWTDGTAERIVRRVEERTSALIVHMVSQMVSGRKL